MESIPPLSSFLETAIWTVLLCLPGQLPQVSGQAAQWICPAGGAWQGESQAFSPGQVRTDSRVLSGAVHSRRFYRKEAQLECADHCLTHSASVISAVFQ